MDERIRILLRAAIRAEGEGEVRVARVLRRRADDVRPLDGVDLPVGVCLAHVISE